MGGNRPRSFIHIDHHVLNSHAVKLLNAENATIIDSLTTTNLNSENATTTNLNSENATTTNLNSENATITNVTATSLIVNGQDINQIVQPGGGLSGDSGTISGTLTANNIITNAVGVILAFGTLNNNTITVDLNDISPSYTHSHIANHSPNSHVGFICVSLRDNVNSTGSIALYTRGKIGNLIVYTVIFEKNTNADSTVSLNTDTGTLTLATNEDITFEIKALNLFEK